MRWFASLVVLCLLAGSGVRPRAPNVRERSDAAQLTAADGLVPLVSPRRGGAVTPEQRLTVFVVTPVAPALVPPARVALPAPRLSIARHVPQSLRPHSARGPPSGGFSVESTLS
jgi:hypothetical protein